MITPTVMNIFANSFLLLERKRVVQNFRKVWSTGESGHSIPVKTVDLKKILIILVVKNT